MKKYKLLIIVIILLLVIAGEDTSSVSAIAHPCELQSQIPPSECYALAALYGSTNGGGWLDDINWMDIPYEPCTWYGVTCGGGHVIALNLDSNNLTGYLPAEIGNLPNLGNFSLYMNSIGGNIPMELSYLSNLVTLDLGSNYFTGNIPSELGNLSNLVILYIDGNPSLTGPIPANFTNLSSLSLFYFDGTDLCEPRDTAFQSWLSGVTSVYSTDVLCFGAPYLVSPVNCATIADRTPRLIWDDVPGAGRHKVQIATDFDFVDVIEQKVVGDVTSTVMSELTDGAYYWRVAAGKFEGGGWVYSDWSDDWYFNLSTLGTPIPTNPTGGDIVPDDTPRFNWTKVTDATRYKIRVSDSPTFSTVLEQKVVGDRSTTVMSSLLDGDYYWKIAAGRFIGGKWQYYDWSVVEPFSIIMLDTPTPTSPGHQTSTTDHTVRLRWTDVVGAERYKVRVEDWDGTLVKFVIVGDKETTVLTPLGDGKYYWQVAAGKFFNGKWNWYNWSDIFAFEIYTP